MKFPTNKLVTAAYESIVRVSDSCEGAKTGVASGCENCQFSDDFVASPAKDITERIAMEDLHPVIFAAAAPTIGYLVQLMFEIGLKCGQLQVQFDGDEEAAAASLSPVVATS